MILSQSSDSQLIQSYVAGNEEAFAILLQRHQEAIFKFIYNKVKEADLANDLFQEAFVKVIQKLKLRMETLVVGDPLDKNTDIGAINSKAQLNTIQNYLSIGSKEGAEMYQSNCSIPSKGFFCKPTLFLHTSQSHRIVQEEIFGPVLAIQTFRTIEEVIEKANNIPYGLSAGVWTDKGAKIFNLTTKLRAGVVWANTYNKFDPLSPFGGYKESGFGREGGLHGLHAYINL